MQQQFRSARAMAGYAGAIIAAMLAFACVQPALAQLAPTVSLAQPPPPEAGSGLIAKPLVTARRQMVVAANPIAAEAGLAILKAGGTAVDAAITTQLVLNVVEPQSSGIGGGAFLVHWSATNKTLTTYDGREMAPAGASPSQFLKSDGTPIPFPAAVLGGTSTGIPGVVALLETVHRAEGKLPWARLFEAAIKLAENGFAVSPRLNATLTSPLAGGPSSFDSASRAYFFDADGKPRPVGYTLKNPELADTLRAIAKGGANAFYNGPIADAVVASVRNAPSAPGSMTSEDLADYRVKNRPPICTTYRRYRICGMGPPSSGALTIGETLILLKPYDLGTAPMAPAALHLIAEAEKLAYADRDRYIADPDAVATPMGMLDKAYLSERQQLINPAKAMEKAAPGQIPQTIQRRAGVDATIEAAGTSHMSIIDAAGNAVAMTTTIESAFGSHRMVRGFLLNNQLTDFSFLPADAEGRPIANAVGPRKRPRSSMSPTIIFAPDGRIFAVLGSAGGSEIILHVTKSIIGLIDWHLDAQSAVDLPNFGSRNGPFELETNVAGALIGLKMALYGQTVRPTGAPSGLHAIVRRRDGLLEGGADARREGAVAGE